MNPALRAAIHPQAGKWPRLASRPLARCGFQMARSVRDAAITEERHGGVAHLRTDLMGAGRIEPQRHRHVLRAQGKRVPLRALDSRPSEIGIP